MLLWGTLPSGQAWSAHIKNKLHVISVILSKEAKKSNFRQYGQLKKQSRVAESEDEKVEKRRRVRRKKIQVRESQ